MFALKALFGCEKSPPVVPVPELPNRLFDVPLVAPKPKPVLVDEVAGWLNVVDPKSPPVRQEQEPHFQIYIKVKIDSYL